MTAMPSRTPLQRLLSPKSIAVAGGAAAAEVVRQCRKLGFSGQIWPVHPRLPEVAGLPCYATVADLPDAPDATFIAVPNTATVEVVRQLRALTQKNAKQGEAEHIDANTLHSIGDGGGVGVGVGVGAGAGGVVCYASGFAEVGAEGVALQHDLVQAAHGMALVGPNCYGFINYLDGVALWPDQHGGRRLGAGERGVAIITQSGNIGLNLTMQRRHLPLAYMVTVGNQAGDGIAAIIAALLDDPRVSAIGMHIEGLDDVAGFSRIAIQALQRKVPLVALKAGSSAAGARTTMSHTSSLAGSDALYDALFTRLGIARVYDVAGLLETCKFLHVHGGLGGRRIATASCSGGEASLMADLAEKSGLAMPALPAAVQTQLEQVLGSKVNVANPLDYHTYIWGDTAASTACFTALLESHFDAHLLVLDLPRADLCDGTSWDSTLDAFIAAKQHTGSIACVLASLPEGMPDAVAQKLLKVGIAPMQGGADCMHAIACATKVGQAQQRADAVLALANTSARATTTGSASTSSQTATLNTLNEVQSKAALAAYGLAIPQGQVCSAQQAPEYAQQIGFPVVVKAVSAQLAHKTEAGGVHLSLHTPEQVSAAVQAMSALSDAFLVERMVRDVVAEVIVGINRDAQFGLALTIGAGGVLVELLKDSITLLLPLTSSDVLHALQSLRVWPLLQGFRGKPLADVDALVQAVLCIANYAQAHDSPDHALQELDVNPILVLPQGQGVLAVDALIVVAQPKPPHTAPTRNPTPYD